MFVFSYDPHEQAMYVKGHLFTDKLKLIEIGNVCNQNSCVFGTPHRFHSVFQNLTVGLLNNKQTWLVYCPTNYISFEAERLDYLMKLK